MKHILIRPAFMLGAAILLNSCASLAQTGNKESAKWVKSGEWKNGLKLDVYSDVTASEFYKQYHANKAVWDKVFAYLKEHDPATLPNGKTQIAGEDATLSVSDATEKELAKTQWESHRKFIDLQYIARGKEKMIVADTSKLTVTEPYNEAKDVAHYAGEGKAYVAEPGTFYLFFPQDAHRPTIKVDGYDVVKKVVVKIRVAK